MKRDVPRNARGPVAAEPIRLARERPLALATIFLTGAGVLVVEIAGSRVVAPLYGSGLYAWSALISVTLASLSLGYWAGGRLADRAPDAARFHTIVFAGGLLVMAVPWVAPTVLRITEPLDPRLGVLLAAALLFCPSLIVLGGVTPFAIRLARPPAGEVGAVSGRFFAVSTIGSLLAALATGFLLIPNLGVKTILMLAGLTVALAGAAGLLASGRAARGTVALLLALGALAGSRVPTADDPSGRLRILARIPSFFGYLRVVETDTERLLTVNGIGQNYVSLVPGTPSSAYLEFMGGVPRMRPAPRREPTGLLIGLGAGELVAKLVAVGVRLTVVEIDPRMVEAARWFALTLPREDIRIADGRAFVERDTVHYDFVFMDAFVGEDVPSHLFTREAFAAMRRRLRPGGLLAINYTTFPNGRDTRSLSRTLHAVFPHAIGFTDVSRRVDLASTVFLASESPIALDPVPAAWMPGADVFLANELKFAPTDGMVLTDDFNPINVYRLGVTRQWRKDMIAHIGENWAYWADF